MGCPINKLIQDLSDIKLTYLNEFNSDIDNAIVNLDNLLFDFLIDNHIKESEVK